MTTREQKIQAITKAIQEAVPDIMELKFGCRIQRESGAIERILWVSSTTNGSGYNYKTHNSTFFDNQAPVKWQWVDSEGVYWAKRNGGENCLILGSPIGIREILLCLNTKSKDEDDYIIMSTDGWFSIVKSDNENDNMLSVAHYNLHKDRIEDQDDELIDFLFTFTQY